ncbi:hypothetical protein F4818DRAFT_451395 [Hypoxylon cercidicola]|nr:hypothetical protein F4818DRAFT_451395 [Hypoxylon cercidicola]
MERRRPGKTAKSVRWAFREGEFERRSLFMDAMAEMKTVIRRKKGLCDSQSRDSLSHNNRTPGGLTFDKLPADIKDIIFDIIASSPSWVHFKIRKGKLVDFDGSNREIYVNKEWYQSLNLRQGLSRNPKLDRRLLGDSCKGWIDRSPVPVRVVLNPHMTLSVRSRVDWFFFDGTAKVKDNFLRTVRTCVVRLHDLYDLIPEDTENKPGKGRPIHPRFIWQEDSRVEELVILVGEFRKGVQPSEMKEIGTFRYEDIPEDDTNDKSWIRDFTHPNSEDLIVSRSQNYMMKKISAHLTLRERQRRRKRQDFLDSEDGKSWLANGTSPWWDAFSKWTATTEGDRWLSSKGSDFLNSKTGHWWLSSEHGYPWLETESGIRWLNTQDAKAFLDSKWALLWANTGTYEPESVPMRIQVRKAWFDTAAGREWKFDHCPNGNPPNRPDLRMKSKPRPRGVKDYPHIAFRRNFGFRGWRFVMSPEDLAYGPKCRVGKPAKELAVSKHIRMCLSKNAYGYY